MHIIQTDDRPTTAPIAIATLVGYTALTALAGWAYLALVEPGASAGIQPASLRYWLVGMRVIMTAFAATAIAYGCLWAARRLVEDR